MTALVMIETFFYLLASLVASIQIHPQNTPDIQPRINLSNKFNNPDKGQKQDILTSCDNCVSLQPKKIAETKLAKEKLTVNKSGFIGMYPEIIGPGQ